MADKTFVKELKEIIKKGDILIGEPLKKYTSFKIGGPAKLLVSPGNEEEIRDSIMLAKKHDVPVFVMGNGTNLLVSDDGFKGLVVHIGKNFSDISVQDDIINVQAGALLSRTAAAALSHSLSGMEFAAGIPGSVGGAVAMNAGAYGGEMKDILVSVTLMDKEGNIFTMDAADMELSYRHSCVFIRELIVLSAVLKLTPGEKAAIEGRMSELALARKTKQPLEYPSAGSTFKRPKGYFAGKLIQDSGLSGFCVGGAMVSKKHCGFVINSGNATAADVLTLINEVKKRVHETFGVDMEPEIKMIGFDEDR